MSATQVSKEILGREPVHVLLTDMHMPRMSGLEIIRHVRHRDLVLPCILISAAVDDVLLEKARNVDAFSILRKPVRLPEVMDVVQRAMRTTYGWPMDR